MTVAEAIIAEARSSGIEHIFGLPGSGAIMDVMDAGRRGGVAFVAMAHESSAALAAAYYGHLKGTAGVAVAIKGPGAGNLAGGAVSAWFERKPVVCLCEVAPSAMRSRPLAQVFDQESLFRGYADAVLEIGPSGAAEAIAEAFRRAAGSRGHPGPVLLGLPSDLGGMALPSEVARGAGGAATRTPIRKPSDGELARARKLIESFSRPVLIIGADVGRSGGLEQAASLARAVGAAVLVTMDARGSFPEDDPRFAAVYAGLPGPRVPANLALAEADGVILAGVDALMTEAPWRSELPAVELCSRPGIATLSPAPAARVDGSLADALAALAVSGRASGPGFPLARIGEIRLHAAGLCERPAGARFAVQDIIRTTRELLPPHGLLFSETGVFVLMLEHVWTVTRPDTFFGTSAGRSMGVMLPALLGAKLARPDLPMVGIGGDGSLLMRLGELETFARTGASAPLVIVNDRCLGTIRARQKYRGLPSWGLDLSDVAFADVARACGLRGVTVEAPDAYRAALGEALLADKATLIDARVDAEPYRDSFVATTGS